MYVLHSYEFRWKEIRFPICHVSESDMYVKVIFEILESFEQFDFCCRRKSSTVDKITEIFYIVSYFISLHLLNKKFISFPRII